MVIRRIQLPQNVVTAARQRIINAFSNGVPMYFSISGGKDSIVLAHLIYQLAREGRIDKSLLTVSFIDEEAMFDDVIQIAADWRKRFLSIGVPFEWFCIEVRHFNCFNQLSNDETFVCWDRYKADVWCRKPPPFAKRGHPLLRPREDSYQEFLTRIHRDGIQMAGLRVAESLMRAQIFRNTYDNPENTLFQPIYDWKDTDVWHYIREHNLDFPMTYMHLYQIGVGRRGMRISQFFSVDTAKTLVQMNEFEPDLMERVSRREPNAYLAALYWDTEMFRSAGKQEKALEGTPADEGKQPAKVDYKTKVFERLNDPASYTTPKNAENARGLRSLIIRRGQGMNQKQWKMCYDILVGGDPKNRVRRALIISLAQNKTQEVRSHGQEAKLHQH